MEGTDFDQDAEWKPLVPKISTSWGPEMPEFSRVGAKARGKSLSNTSLVDIGKFFRANFGKGFLGVLLIALVDYLPRHF
jgi:hypothetical protein